MIDWWLSSLTSWQVGSVQSAKKYGNNLNDQKEGHE